MEPLYIAFGVLAIAIGLIFTFLGWRLWNILVFIAGFFVGFSITFRLVLQLLVDGYGELDWTWWTSLGVGILVGLLLGMLVVKLIPLGFFLAGAALGVGLGTTIDRMLIEYVDNYPDWGYWVVMVICVIVLGLIAVKVGKAFIMVSTAISGSFATWNGVRYFIEGQNFEWIEIMYWVGIVVLAILGIIVQFKIFGSHEHDKYSKVPRKAPPAETEMGHKSAAAV